MEFKNMFINMIEPSDVKLLRQRYNINGTHAGFIYYTTNTFDYVDDAESIAGAISLRVGDNTHLEVYGPSEIIASDKPVNDKIAIRTTLNNVGGDKNIGEVNIYTQETKSEHRDVSLIDCDTGGTIAMISCQVKAELKYHYANEHIIQLIDVLTGLFINAYYYKSGQGKLPDGDTLKKYIRRSISGWLSSRK